MAWHVALRFLDHSEDFESMDTFDTEEDAREEGRQMVSDYNTGGEILHMSNPGDYSSSWEEPEVDVWED